MLGTSEQRKRRRRSGMPLHTRGDGVGGMGEAGRSHATEPFQVELVEVPVSAGATDARRWGWARHWDFWVAMVVGAFLRLWHLDLSTFLADQRMMFLLAREAVVDHALPVAGVPTSAGPYSLPYGAYFLLPFAALGMDPFPAIVSIALWNVLGVAMCYIFALRYFRRPVAAIGTLLFATSGMAVNYSRFIWNPNYLPPLLGLWALTVFAGAARGRRGWLAPAVALLVLAFSVHPVAIILVPVTLVALLLAPRWPSGRECAAAAAVGAVLLVPTMLWESVSDGVDLHLWAAYSRQQAVVSLTVLRVLYGALGAPSAGDFGPPSLYAAYARWYPAINALAALFFAAGYMLLTWRLIAPAWRLWTAQPATTSWWQAIRSWAVATWRGERADVSWRTHTLLWLWVTMPLLAMVRHNSVPRVHYLLIIFPAAFIVAGLPVGWAIEHRVGWSWVGGRLATVAAPGVAIGLAGLLVAAQAAQSTLYPASLATGRFSALAFYGYPLGEVQAADRALSTLQRQQGASAVYVSLPAADRFRLGMDYLLVSEHADRVGFSDNCLVLPRPAAAPALVVSASAGSPTAALLPSLPNARHVADISMAGGAGFAVYRVSGLTPLLPDEKVLTTPVFYRDAAGNGLRLEAAALQTPQMLRLRWTVLRSTPPGKAAEWYHVQASSPGARAGSDGTPAGVECQPASWQAGETVFTWAPRARAAGTAGQPAAAIGSLPGGMTVAVSESTEQPDAPWLGPLHLLSGRYVGQAPEELRPTVASTAPSESATAALTRAGARAVAPIDLTAPARVMEPAGNQWPAVWRIGPWITVSLRRLSGPLGVRSAGQSRGASDPSAHRPSTPHTVTAASITACAAMT